MWGGCPFWLGGVYHLGLGFTSSVCGLVVSFFSFFFFLFLSAAWEEARERCSHDDLDRWRLPLPPLRDENRQWQHKAFVDRHHKGTEISFSLGKPVLVFQTWLDSMPGKLRFHWTGSFWIIDEFNDTFKLGTVAVGWMGSDLNHIKGPSQPIPLPSHAMTPTNPRQAPRGTPCVNLSNHFTYPRTCILSNYRNCSFSIKINIQINH